MSNTELSVVLPCLNEQDTIGAVIAELQFLLKEMNIPNEILVVDNGSEDASVEIAVKHGARVVLESKRGYGSALKRGIREARGTYTVFLDADLSYEPNSIPRMIEKLGQGYDLCIGNRFIGRIEARAMPFLHKYLGNPVLSLIGRRLYNVNIGDFHCGIRSFKTQSVKQLNLTSPGMEFASELIVKAALAGLSISEVPTTLRKDGRGRPPHLRTWRDGWRHLIFLLVHAPTKFLLVPTYLSLLIALILNGLVLAGLVFQDQKHLIAWLSPLLISFSVSSFWLAMIVSGISKTMNLRNNLEFFQKINRRLSIENVLSWATFLLVIGTCLLLTIADLNIISMPFLIILFSAFSTSIFISILGAFALHLMKINQSDK